MNKLTKAQGTNYKALFTLVTVFFFWGFVAASNDILIPVFKYIFKTRIYLKDVIISFLIAAIGLSSFFVATFRFNSW